MELKFATSLVENYKDVRSNRTFMELKYRIIVMLNYAGMF